MVTIIGNELLFILDSGVTEVSAVELYSRWKEWALIPGNLGFPQAFRVEGGSTIAPGLTTGEYVFLQNQFGWRVRPPEEDINISLTGNFIAEDGTRDIVTPTLGAFTVLINGLQPITQGIDGLREEISKATDFARDAAANTQPI